MRQELKDILTNNRVDLAENIELDDNIWNRLIKAKIILKNQKEAIKLNRTTFEQVGELLDRLEKRDDDAYMKFRNIFEDLGQTEILNYLPVPADTEMEDAVPNRPNLC